MNSSLKYILAIAISGMAVPGNQLFAGNPERAGQAGATQLLINPYARSSGQAGANTANARGLEAQFLNVAGTAFTRKTEVMFQRSAYLVGTDININAFGITQRVGETGAIGLGVMSLNAGKIDITTEDQPEGGLGTFTPQFINISLSYAKGFSDNIYGGIAVKVISESISNVSAKGVAIDAGIQYHTGKYDQIHFGIALKNVGPKMQYRGDGLSFTTVASNGVEMTVEQRSAGFELPSLVNIGGSYDIYLTKDSSGVSKTHRLSISGNFTSNSFSYDNYLFGLEYGWKNMLMIRGGLSAEKNIFKSMDQRMTAYTGPTCGMTFEIPFGEKKSTFGLDYSYRFTKPFGGTHSFGVRINL